MRRASSVGSHLSHAIGWPHAEIDLTTAAQVQLLASASGEPVSSVAWSQKGTYLAAGGECGAVSIYDAATVSALPASGARTADACGAHAGAVPEQWADEGGG